MVRSETNTVGDRRVYLETFGCQMNVLDSQLVQGQLRALGYEFVDRPEGADVVLYNTCSVREHAEQKVYSRLGRIAAANRGAAGPVVGVIGCMAEREGTALSNRFPQIDVLCGPGELDKLPLLINNAVRTKFLPSRSRRAPQTALQGDTHRRSATLSAAEDQLEMLDLSRSFSPDDHHGSAYVRITRGCNKFCSYCVVPRTRGAEVHRPPDHIVEECRRLVDAGVVEITLLGQTVNHYRFDHNAAVTSQGVLRAQIGAVVTSGSGPQPRHTGAGGSDTAVAQEQATTRITSFADLLARVHDEVSGLARLRFVTSFPRDFGDDILEVMRARPRICRYLHLPVQSGSNRILGLMNRGYTVQAYRQLIQRVRRFLPDCQIATDVICGYPTETDEDHEATADLLRWGQFKNAFIFKYSPRPGTTACERQVDDVPEPLKRSRNHELLEIQNTVSARVHAAMIGSTVDVFIESVSARSRKRAHGAGPAITLGWEKPQTVTQLTGRTGGDLIVLLDAEPDLVGSVVKVRIERSAPLMLFGRLVGEQVEACKTPVAPVASG
jgi:tRNA-2-methylthio-N6-dimethylallyladenosine synthase